jgi:hypothetical protein
MDATDERLSHAERAGLDAVSHEIRTPSGFATGARYRKIDGPIDVALKRGWIRERHYLAGSKFFECLHAVTRQPRLTGPLQASVDGSRSTAAVSDYRMRAQDELRAALLALPIRYRDPFFSWAAMSLYEDISVKSLGGFFSKAKRADNVTKTGKRRLLEILNILAKHYGF